MILACSLKVIKDSSDLANAELSSALRANRHAKSKAESPGDCSLKLSTASVSGGIYAERKMLTRQIPDPASTAAVIMDISGMHHRNKASLVLLW